MTPIIGRVKQRCLVYAARHSNKIDLNKETLTMKIFRNIREELNINIHDNETQSLPNNFFPPSIHLCPVEIENPNFLNYKLSIYTDDSKSEIGTGAFAIFID